MVARAVAVTVVLEIPSTGPKNRFSCGLVLTPPLRRRVTWTVLGKVLLGAGDWKGVLES